MDQATGDHPIRMISHPFHRVLSRTDQILVDSLFKDVLNVMTWEGLFCIQNPAVPRSPLSGVLSDPVDFRDLPLSPGMTLTIRSGVIFHREVRFRFSNSVLFDSGLITPSTVESKLQQVDLHLDLLKKTIMDLMVGKDLLSGLPSAAVHIASADEEPFSPPEQRSALTARYFHKVLFQWREALQFGHLPDPQLLTSLIGLGHGLTPSGDDFLVGMLSAFHYLNSPAEKYRLITNMIEQVLASADGKTTAVSAAYFREALRRRYSDTLLQFYEAIEQEDRDPIRGAIEKIALTGHSSGLDTLSGTLNGFTSIAILNRNIV